VKNWTDSRLLNLEVWFNCENVAFLLQDFRNWISCPSQKPNLERPTQYCRFLLRFSKHTQISGRSRAELRCSVTSLATPIQNGNTQVQIGEYSYCYRQGRIFYSSTVRIKTGSTVVGGYQLFGVLYGLHRQGQGGDKVYKDDTKSIHSMEYQTSW